MCRPTPADSAYDQFGNIHVAARRLLGRCLDAPHGLDALADRLQRAAFILNDIGFDRPARCLDMALQGLPVKAFATERHQHHAADIGMGAQALHHPVGVFIGITAGKADQVDFAVVARVDDFARHMVGALDEIGDADDVADALAAVGAQPGLERHISAHDR